MGCHIDNDMIAYVYCLRVLYGIFIVVIAVLNVIFICKSCSNNNAVQNPRRYIAYSIAFGNLLFASFPLLHEELVINMGAISCEFTLLSQMYSKLHSFATGFSLVMLSVELYARKKLQSMTNKPIWVGVLLSGLVWVIGLVTILLVFLPGFNFPRCNYEHDKDATKRLQIGEYVCVIVPACFVLLAGIVTKVIKIQPRPEFYNQQHTSSEMILHQPQSSYLPSPGTADIIQTNPGSNQDEVQSGQLARSETVPHHNYESETEHPYNRSQTAPHHTNEHDTDHSNNPCQSLPRGTEFGMDFRTMSQLFQDLAKEKNLLLALSLLYFFLGLLPSIYRLSKMASDFEHTITSCAASVVLIIIEIIAYCLWPLWCVLFPVICMKKLPNRTTLRHL